MEFSREIQNLQLKDLQLIAFDFDGIFTNDKVFIDENGRESVVCSRSDSLGVAKLKQEIDTKNFKTKIIVVSTETNRVVSARCQKMKLQAFTGVDDKAKFIANFAISNGIDLKYSLYAGNDLNDFTAMSLFGFRFAPENAHPKIKGIATNNLTSYGGNGFVRELTEIIAPAAFED